ncbi:hypothetical protein HN031_03205 [Nocardioides sp. zg-1308]|uniref:hypothetical protein n=1 Tax=Nocardioides sp. zg-1308 TaxID=2736253 RepID=UPI0015524727|nr:hypothetical protein [Nocardioides sp. zg-1308]NPD03690.1 hypothetical protein [Nocardioides sp. zg-1308]
MAISELVGVYDADGGLLGEAAYVWGRLRGTRHCGLCDITHSTVRRKADWDRMAASLPVPVRLLHLNELDDGLRRAVASTGAPVVLGREGDEWRQVVGREELDEMAGSVGALEVVLRRRLGDPAGGTD